MRLSAARCGRRALPKAISCDFVEWRTTADEDGHYCLAIALRRGTPSRAKVSSLARAFSEARHHDHCQALARLVTHRRVDAQRSIKPRAYPSWSPPCGKPTAEGANHLKSQARPRLAQSASKVATCAYSSLVSVVSARPLLAHNWLGSLNVGFSIWMLKPSVSSEHRSSVFETVT